MTFDLWPLVALNSLICADVLLRNYSLTGGTLNLTQLKLNSWGVVMFTQQCRIATWTVVADGWLWRCLRLIARHRNHVISRWQKPVVMYTKDSCTQDGRRGSSYLALRLSNSANEKLGLQLFYVVISRLLISIFLSTRQAACCIILVMSVCVYVCQTITLESSYSHVWYIFTVYGLSAYMKVIGSRSRSQEPKRSKIPIPAM